MTGLIYLALAIILGFTFTRWLGLKLTAIEVASFSFITGLFGFTWITLLPALFLPYWLSLPLGCFATLTVSVFFFKRGNAFLPYRLHRNVTVIWGIIAVLSAFFWGTLMFSHDLPYSSTLGLMSAGSTWADFGLHASIVSHQALATRLPLDLPLASGTPITYPFLIDYLSALFLRGGWNLNYALAVPGTVLAWSITQLILSFGWRLWGRFGGAILGLVLILTSGSAAGAGVAFSDWRSSSLPLTTWLTKIPQNYSGIDLLNVHFNNAVADLLLPQRAFLFGLGIWLVAAILWHATLDGGRRRWLYASAVLVGLMPLAHPHSFVAACTLFGGLITWIAFTQRVQLKAWLISAAIIGLIALPQLIWQLLRNPNGTGGHVIDGWTRLPTESLLGYEWYNFGLFLGVLIALAFLITRPKWRSYQPWIIPFLLLFILAHIYSLQPYAYDNLKLFFYVYVIGMLALGGLVWRLRTPILRYSAVVFCLVAFSVPGTLTIARDFQLQYQFASLDDLQLASWVQKNTRVSDIFATTDSPNQPVATVGGRSIILGYRGWLYNYHLDYSAREAAIRALLLGDTTNPNIITYHPNYLAVRSQEPSDWTVDISALAKLNLVYSNATWSIYKLEP